MRSRAPSPTKSVLRSVLVPALGLTVCGLPALSEATPTTPCAAVVKQSAPGASHPGEARGPDPVRPPGTTVGPDAGAPRAQPPGEPPAPGTSRSSPPGRRVQRPGTAPRVVPGPPPHHRPGPPAHPPGQRALTPGTRPPGSDNVGLDALKASGAREEARESLTQEQELERRSTLRRSGRHTPGTPPAGCAGALRRRGPR